MTRTRIFLTMLTMTQVKAIEVTFDLKAHSATQARTEVISHQNPYHGLWMKYT